MISRFLDVDGRRLLLTDLDKVVWDEGPTKDEIINHYLDLADQVLPFLVGRPVSLLRAPDSAAEEWTFHKTAPPGLPAWMSTRRIRTERAAVGHAEYVVPSDKASLAYLANLGVVSFHPWACRIDTLERPDELLLDLDPTEIAFREVRNAAMLVRDLLAAHRIRSWVKTSGGRGLHLMVPLAPVHSFEEVLAAAETVTRLARTREPSLFTLDMRRARRRGKILIDVHRNHRGATIVSPYSIRDRSAECVSTPLDWPELERPIYPEDFHMKNVRERLRERRNPLWDFFASGQLLAPLLERSRSRRVTPSA